MAVFGGEGERGRDANDVGGAFVVETYGLFEGMGEGFDVGGAGEERSVADDDDEVVRKGGGYGGKVTVSDSWFEAARRARMSISPRGG